MELKFVLESILFAAQKPLNPRELREVLSIAADQTENEEIKALKKLKEEEFIPLLEELERDHAAANRSYRLACVAGSWQFVSQPDYAPWIMALVGQKPRPPRLSQPALETLTIIAYRQPITRSEIEQVRGVAVDGVMGTLVERGLVVVAGRAEVVGRPSLYATTPLFLEYFGLGSLEDLPAAEELRRIPVKRPESLLTVENGLATSAPAELALAPEAASAPAEAVSVDALVSGIPAETAPEPAPDEPAAADAAPAVSDEPSPSQP